MGNLLSKYIKRITNNNSYLHICTTIIVICTMTFGCTFCSILLNAKNDPIYTGYTQHLLEKVQLRKKNIIH